MLKNVLALVWAAMRRGKADTPAGRKPLVGLHDPAQRFYFFLRGSNKGHNMRNQTI